MAHAQKPDFVFRRNGRVHLNRRGASVQSTAGSRNVRISGSNAGYTMFQGSVKSTGYPLHSPVSPSLPLPCVTVCHHISAGVCYMTESYTKSYKMKPACNGTVRNRIFFLLQAGFVSSEFWTLGTVKVFQRRKVFFLPRLRLRQVSLYI